MNTHSLTRLKFRDLPSKLTGPNQMSRGLSLMFYKESRQDTSVCKKGESSHVLCTKDYCVPTRMRWACKNCQAPQGVVQASICTLPAPPILTRAWCRGTVQNQDTVTVPWPTCLMWDLQEGGIQFFVQYSWAWGPANILGSQSWNARSFNKIAGTRGKETASAQKAC